MTWKIQVCPKRMRSPGINGEGELRGQPAKKWANPGSPGKIAVRMECVLCIIFLAMTFACKYSKENTK